MALLLVALIAWQLARIIWMLVPVSEPPACHRAAAGSGGRAAVASGGDANIDYIVNAHLFGRFDTSTPLAELDPVDAPDTRLNLELRGTIAAEDGRAGDYRRARPRRESLRDRRRGIGRGLAAHRLYRPRPAAPGWPTGDPATAEGDRVREPAVRHPGARGPRPAGPAASGEIVSQAPAKLTDVIRPQPVFRDGQQQGYRVYPGRDRQRFSALGLRPGDLITQINGMSLDDPARGMEIFRSLGDATQVSVTLERSGQAQVLTLDTSQLSGADATPKPRSARSTDEDE